jgi:hypothetical protein
MKKKAPPGSGGPNYGTTPIARLKKSRKGKHHDLMGRIMEDLRQLRAGFAVRIPLSSTTGVPVLNLRSVIVRTAAREKMRVATSSDDENFYVWRV